MKQFLSHESQVSLVPKLRLGNACREAPASRRGNRRDIEPPRRQERQKRTRKVWKIGIYFPLSSLSFLPWRSWRLGGSIPLSSFPSRSLGTWENLWEIVPVPSRFGNRGAVGVPYAILSMMFVCLTN